MSVSTVYFMFNNLKYSNFSVSLTGKKPKLSYSQSNYHSKFKVLVAQSCPTLCDPMDCSPPGSSVHGILQARILEWIAMPSSRVSSWPRDQTHVSCIASRFLTIWVTREAQPSHTRYYLRYILCIIKHNECFMAVISIHAQKSSFVGFFFLYINEHLFYVFTQMYLYRISSEPFPNPQYCANWSWVREHPLTVIT